MNTGSLESLVLRAREGDENAYGVIVRRFQDMAVGYGYSILRDFQLAEDAAQEAFFEAYRSLEKLREPAAFPGWFRRIVFKQCDRLIRGKSIMTVPLDAAREQAAVEPDQCDEMEQREMKDRVLEAVDALPENERAATMLYYIGGYSQVEIGEFLDAPVTTVKKRLHSARSRLREMLIDAVEESLRERRPSRDEQFAGRLMEILKAARAGDAPKVKELLELDPRLLAARDPLGNTALILAVNSGHNEIAELLLNSGVQPGLHEAAAIGKTQLVAEQVRGDKGLVDSYSPEGFTALALAAHFGHKETAAFLIDQGADVNAVARHEMRVTPLHAALFGRQVETATLLVERGADVTIKRGGKGWRRSGWTALHYVAGFGFVDLVEPLLTRGADHEARDDEGRTPLDVAVEARQAEMVEVLRLHATQGNQ
ncbi:MAG TPA: sigma-70 family RNA polymerase sigma factor [Blastocatellia bacterium]|nr:sigma-70 family RNA polymerase sigma factor [Blastocatellia bacterium]